MKEEKSSTNIKTYFKVNTANILQGGHNQIQGLRLQNEDKWQTKEHQPRKQNVRKPTVAMSKNEISLRVLKISNFYRIISLFSFLFCFVLFSLKTDLRHFSFTERSYSYHFTTVYVCSHPTQALNCEEKRIPYQARSWLSVLLNQVTINKPSQNDDLKTGFFPAYIPIMKC